MKCDCGRGWYIEKRITFRSKKIWVEVCNVCGADLS